MAADKMNRKQRKELTRQLRSEDPGLDVVHPRAAGIDVGNGAHYVAVRPDQDREPVRRYECFTADLHRLADWLEACGVETVAMQSTGVYWIPLYEILEERGFEVYLVNARHTKNLPGRKSDVQESQWLLKLHTYGLLRNSFRPTQEIRTMRTYWRQRNDLDQLTDLHRRVHRGAYGAMPSRRVYIEKADGRQRPLAVPAIEDKLVQHAVITILNQIYEEDFLGFSYDFKRHPCR